MAEPLSLAASIIALATVGKITFETIRSVAEGPEQLRHLSAEVEHITIITNELSRIRDDTAQGYLTTHIDTTRTEITKLQAILNQCIKGTAPARFSTVAWARHRLRLGRLEKELQRKKLMLLADVHVLGLKRITEIAALHPESPSSLVQSRHVGANLLSSPAQRASNEVQQVNIQSLRNVRQDNRARVSALNSSHYQSGINLQMVHRLSTGTMSPTLARKGKHKARANNSFSSPCIPVTSSLDNSRLLSPQTILESSPVFFGEAYTLENSYGSNFFLMSHMSISTERCRTEVYIINYALNSRQWAWVTVFIEAPNDSDHSILSLIPQGINRLMLEDKLESKYELQKVVLQDPSLHNGSQLKLTLNDTATVDSQLLLAGSYLPSRCILFSCGERMLNMAKHLGCPQFPERLLEFRKRRFPGVFRVTVHSNDYFYHLLSPDYPEQAQDFEKILDQVRTLHILRHSKNILGIGGIVLHDSGEYAMGYLIRCPSDKTYSRMAALLAYTEVSWERRQKRAQGLVQAVAELHSAGYSVGRIRHGDVFGQIFIDSKDTPILLLRNIERLCSGSSMNQQGTLAPEVRQRWHQYGFSAAFEASPEVDLFNLGMLLWIIASHIPFLTPVSFCRRVGCTYARGSKCFAEHLNPVQLPLCSDPEVPTWYQDIIAICRYTDPGLRKPAWELLAMFPPQEEIESRWKEDRVGLAAQGETVPVFPDGIVYVCSACEKGIAGSYHCDICEDGDFDLCLECVANGLHCFDIMHSLYWQDIVDNFAIRSEQIAPLVGRQHETRRSEYGPVAL